MRLLLDQVTGKVYGDNGREATVIPIESARIAKRTRTICQLTTLLYDLSGQKNAENQLKSIREQNRRVLREILNVTSLLAVVVALAATLTLSSVAEAKTLTVNPNRLIEVIDVIDFSIIQQAQLLDSLSRQSQEPIYILVNSPGGIVQAGTLFASAMVAARSRGVTLKCFSGVLAASMAFNLLAFCNQRYALPFTKLLFHPVRVNGEVKPSDIPMLNEELRRVERTTLGLLVQMMGMPLNWVLIHYRAETFWEAMDLVEATKDGDAAGWLQIVEDVSGTSHLFQIQRPRLFPQQQGRFRLTGDFRLPGVTQ